MREDLEQFDIFLKVAIEIALIMLFLYALAKASKYFAYFAFRKLRRKKSIFIISIVSGIRRAVVFFIWLFGLLECVDIFIVKICPQYSTFTVPITTITIYLSTLIVFMRTITRIKKRYISQRERRRKKVDIVGLDGIEKISKITVFMVWFLSVLDQSGVNLSALMAFGGAGGVIVGLAGRDMFANIFGGLVLYFDKPFSVGDYVESPDREITGTIESIDWRQTKIISNTNIPIYVPNSVFGVIIIRNRSRIKFYKVDEEVALNYNDFAKVETIITEIVDMLKKHPNINKRVAPYSCLLNVTNNLVLRIVAITSTNSYQRYAMIKQDILIRVIEIVKKNEAGIILPTGYMKMLS
jgi:MscS family membrane protein